MLHCQSSWSRKWTFVRNENNDLVIPGKFTVSKYFRNKTGVRNNVEFPSITKKYLGENKVEMADFFADIYTENTHI